MMKRILFTAALLFAPLSAFGASRLPLVQNGAQTQQLQSGDTLKLPNPPATTQCVHEDSTGVIGPTGTGDCGTGGGGGAATSVDAAGATSVTNGTDGKILTQSAGKVSEESVVTTSQGGFGNVNGIGKGDGLGNVSVAVAGTDYSPPIQSGSPNIMVSPTTGSISTTVTRGNNGADITGTTYAVNLSAPPAVTDLGTVLNFTGTAPSAWTLGAGAAGEGLSVDNHGTADITITCTGNCNGSATLVIHAGENSDIYYGTGTWWANVDGGGGGSTTLTGDVTGSGTGTVATTLATVNSNTGSFGDATHCASFTVNGKGLVTAASQSTTCPGGGGGGSTTIIAPQGRITLVTGVPVMNAEETAKTTVYYTALFAGGGSFNFPWYNGSAWTMQTASADLSETLDATNFLANTLYDEFLFVNAGTPELCYGPAWATSTPGSGARGTGAGTTQLNTVGGQPFGVNAVSITCRQSSSTTFTVPAGEGLYVGTIGNSPTAGQVQAQFRPAAAAGGDNTNLGICNAFNQVPTRIRSQDSTATPWSYAVATWHSANSSNTNRVNFIDCLGTVTVTAGYTDFTYNGGLASDAGQVGVDENSTTATPNSAGTYYNGGGSGIGVQTQSDNSFAPLLGVRYYQAMENAPNSVSTSFYGTYGGSEVMNLFANVMY